MIEVKITGSSAEEVVTKLRDLLAAMGGGEAAPKKGKNIPLDGKKDEADKPPADEKPEAEAGKDITEESLRAAWAEKKAEGCGGAHLKSVLDACGGAANIGLIDKKHYTKAMKLIKALKAA